MASSAPTALADGLAMAAVRLTRTLRALNRTGKLTGPEISALAVIVYAERIKAKDLAEFEEVSAPAISTLINGLEAKGYVRRAKDPDDARALWITATPQGARLLREGHARRIAPLAAAIAELSAKDRALVAEAAEIIDRLAAAAREKAG